MSDDEDDDDDDSSSDEDSAGVAGLSIDSFDVCEKCENSIDSSWKVPLFNDLFNLSREAASHLSDEAGESRNMLSPDVDNIDAHKLVAEHSQMLLAFSARAAFPPAAAAAFLGPWRSQPSRSPQTQTSLPLCGWRCVVACPPARRLLARACCLLRLWAAAAVLALLSVVSRLTNDRVEYIIIENPT